MVGKNGVRASLWDVKEVQLGIICNGISVLIVKRT